VSHPPDDLFAALQAALHPHYRLERELGRGGMGVVYEATDRTLERRVAIKVAYPELAERPAIAQRFLAEARMLARIRHPNIVAVHQAGRVDNLLYYVMDEVPGESLRQLLNREGALTIDRARAIVQDLADALEVAGRAGFVHRDVKPENVLLDRATGRALLTDFGIARTSDEEHLEGTTTGQGIAVGTPTYMSPEQAAGEPVDPRSDLYALGVVAYEMLAGQPPFVGPNRVIVSRHLTELPPALDRVRPDVPGRFAAAVMRALAKSPTDRWQSGSAMRRAIGGDEQRPRWRRQRVWVGTALAAALIAVGWAALRRGGPPPGVDPRHSMLLLPFENLQRDRSLAWLEDGSVSMLGLNLGQWTDLSVVEHDRLHDIMARQGLAPGDPIGLEMARRMAREAGVWTVVRGEFSWAGDTLRLVARVYDVASGQRVHVARVDGRPGRDVRPLFDALATRLLDLSGAPADAVGPGLAATTTHSVEAFRLYLTGLDHLNHWNLTAARTAFDQAVSIDTTFAMAYYRLAQVRGWVGSMRDSVGRAALRRAMRFSASLPEPQRIAISAYQSFLDMDLVTARSLYQRLLARDRNDREAWNGLGETWYHDTTVSQSLAFTQAYRALRRALAIDPAYAVPFLHLTDLLRMASDPRPAVELLPGDSLHSHDTQAPRARGSPDALARARAQWVTDARNWVLAQPTTRFAHVSLLDASLRAGDHAAALAEIDRYLAVAGEHYGEHPFERASVEFAAGRLEQAAAMASAALDTVRAAALVQSEGRTEIVRAIAATTNVFAYRGDVERARRVIALAAEVSARFDSTLGRGWNLPPDLVSRRMLGDLYAALGGPVPSLRQLWTTAAEARRRPRSGDALAEIASGASAAIGLLTAGPGGDTIAVTELRPLIGGAVPAEVEALVALARRDTAAARRLVARTGERSRSPGDPRLRYTVYSIPLAAQVYYALGDYPSALRVTEGFDPAEFDVRSFDMRWGILPRTRLLRGFAYERLGRTDSAAAEYEAVLRQWSRADPLVDQQLGQAERGLRRLGRGSERLAALGYEMAGRRHSTCQ
jgi:eukaryotic-like serine/threonine-protein kinase